MDGDAREASEGELSAGEDAPLDGGMGGWPAEADTEPDRGGLADAPDDDGIVGAQGQRISASEIQLVQNLVERCLQARRRRNCAFSGRATPRRAPLAR